VHFHYLKKLKVFIIFYCGNYKHPNHSKDMIIRKILPLLPIFSNFSPATTPATEPVMVGCAFWLLRYKSETSKGLRKKLDAPE